MPTIENFWEGGPHDPVDVEQTWQEFVRSVGGTVVEDLIREPRTFENADFVFLAESVVAELKEVATEFGRTNVAREGLIGLIQRVADEDPSWRPTLLGGSGHYPDWFILEFLRLFRPPLSRILKKANRQIRETKKHFDIQAPTGLLVLVNDGFTGLEPHFVRSIVSDLLMSSYSSIDCFLYVTLNRYVEVLGSDVPRLLWMPLYSDRAPAYLVPFIDDLGRKWFTFLEKKIGPFTVPRVEIPQGDGSSNAILSRAIVLPGENR